jgi:hypothetical protein
MKRVAADAAELKTLAKNLSERTELIESQLKAQLKKNDKTTAELEENRAKTLSLSAELKVALQNAVTLQKELAAAKEQLHAHETRAIKAAAEARHSAEALASARNRIAELEADDRAAQAEINDLRAELAEAWSTSSARGDRPTHQHVAVVVARDGQTADADGVPVKRVEDDLRYERMHVEQLERRLNSWTGLATAALRKVTRLGRKPARKPQRKRLPAPGTPAASTT